MIEARVDLVQIRYMDNFLDSFEHVNFDYLRHACSHKNNESS